MKIFSSRMKIVFSLMPDKDVSITKLLSDVECIGRSLEIEKRNISSYKITNMITNIDQSLNSNQVHFVKKTDCFCCNHHLLLTRANKGNFTSIISCLYMLKNLEILSMVISTTSN